MLKMSSPTGVALLVVIRFDEDASAAACQPNLMNNNGTAASSDVHWCLHPECLTSKAHYFTLEDLHRHHGRHEEVFKEHTTIETRVRRKMPKCKRHKTPMHAVAALEDCETCEKALASAHSLKTGHAEVWKRHGVLYDLLVSRQDNASILDRIQSACTLAVDDVVCEVTQMTQAHSLHECNPGPCLDLQLGLRSGLLQLESSCDTDLPRYCRWAVDLGASHVSSPHTWYPSHKHDPDPAPHTYPAPALTENPRP